MNGATFDFKHILQTENRVNVVIFHIYSVHLCSVNYGGNEQRFSTGEFSGLVGEEKL